jgi:hypothetical protein
MNPVAPVTKIMAKIIAEKASAQITAELQPDCIAARVVIEKNAVSRAMTSFPVAFVMHQDKMLLWW